MEYDTAGNKIYKPILYCNCGFTGGCEKCNFHWIEKLSKLEEDQRKLDDWKKRFDEDLERRSKILFPLNP